MYRLLALDLDGTLLRHDQRVDERDIAAVAELQRAGVVVTIITGRLHSGSVGAARACAIEGAIGCAEGSHLVEAATGATIAHHAFGDDEAALLRGAFVEHGLSTFVFARDGIHHEAGGAPFADYIATWSPNLRVVDAGAPWAADPICAVAIGDAEPVARAAAALSAHASRVFSVSFAVGRYPDKHAVLVRAAGPTKGTALAELCRASNVSLAESVVVGDWLNDVPMFEVAGRSFAMGGAPASVAGRATDRLARLAGSGGGIAEAIRKAWG